MTKKECLEASTKLPELSESMKSRILKKVPAFFYKWRGKYYCSDCGEEEKLCVCKTKYGHFDKRTLNFVFHIFTTYKNVQVIRTFWVIKSCHVSEPYTVSFHEIYQNWIFDSKHVVIGKKIKFMSSDNFDLWSDFAIKRPEYSRLYDFDSWYIVARWSDELKRKCCDKFPKWASRTKWVLTMLKSNKMETLYKIGILNKTLFNFDEITERYYNQILKAHKHGIIIDDYNIWFDCFRMMENLGMDINNPSLYLPVKESLMDIHDRLFKLVEKKREKEMKEKAKKKALEQEKINNQYVKRMKLFMGLSINSGNIVISPLENIKDFFIEGEIMHHCVYTMEYYKKKRSLILSAKNTNGDRVETVEYDTLTNQVIQSRGKCNSVTDYHETIVNAVENSLELKKLCEKYVKKHYNS